jgi:hypothetical protein
MSILPNFTPDISTAEAGGPAARTIPSRRAVLLGGGAIVAAAAVPSFGAPETTGGGSALTPEMFGARGDGLTNDTDAFGRLAAEIGRRGGGTIALRRTTYLVGRQERNVRPGATYGFEPAGILAFRNLPAPLTILGNGATLRCPPGLRYGTFDPLTGEATRRHPMPFFEQRQRASAYEYMIFVEGCRGSVTISDLELDGNLGKMIIGGPYGDTGIQIAGSGIFLRDNRGSETLRRIHAHHHPQDGIIIDGLSGPVPLGVVRSATDLRCEYNGRQGCSLTGGRAWSFTRCTFSHTGKAGIASAPAAGFDIEAEGSKTIRDVSFADCVFSDNVGCGLVADSGDSEGASFLRCRFIGTTMWSAWPNKPLFRFRGCTFVGSIVHCYGDKDPHRAAQFYDCTFTDDPALSPTREVYREGRPNGSIADLGEEANVLFEGCRFLAVGGAVLPWSMNVIYSNCTMRQTARSAAYPRGTYLGHSTIDAPQLGLYGSKILGEVKIVGNPIRL